MLRQTARSIWAVDWEQCDTCSHGHPRRGSSESETSNLPSSLFFPRNSSNEISFCELPFLYVVLYVVLDSWTHVGLDTIDSSIL